MMSIIVARVLLDVEKKALMDPVEIKNMLTQKMLDAEITVTGDGRHFQVIVISELFNGMGAVARQRQIYSILNDAIQDGRIHAISIKTYTQTEWENKN